MGMIVVISLFVLYLLFFYYGGFASGLALSGMATVIFSFISPLASMHYFLLQVGIIGFVVGGVLYLLKKLLRGV